MKENLYLIKYLKSKEDININNNSLFLSEINSSNDLMWTDNLSIAKKFDRNSALTYVGSLIIDYDCMSTIVPVQDLKEFKIICPSGIMVIIADNQGDPVQIFAEHKIYDNEIYQLIEKLDSSFSERAPHYAWRINSYGYNRVCKNIILKKGINYE